MSISTTRPAGCGAALSLRLGAILALTAFLALGAGAKDAQAAECTECGPPPVIQDFYFNFSATLDGGSISGGGMLMAQQQSPGVWLVTDATGALNLIPPNPVTPASMYSLNLLPPNTWPPNPIWPSSPIVPNNDNLLIIYGTAAQLTNQGISFAVGDGFGNLNIADPPFSYNVTTDFAGTGTGSFFATPGPTPGTGLAGLAFLILAGATARARGLLAR